MTNQIHNAEAASAITEEVKLIPRWSIAAASLAFVFMQYLYWVILPAYRQSLHMRPVAAPLGVRFYFALSWSTLAALYVLMVGYVSRDAPRRSHEHTPVGRDLPGFARAASDRCFTFCFASPWLHAAPRVAPASTPSSISALSAPTRSPRLAAIATAACASLTSTASTAATAWLRITCPPASVPSSPDLSRIDRPFFRSLYS